MLYWSLTLVLTRVPLALYPMPLSARVSSCLPLFLSCLLCSYVFLSATTQYGRQKKGTEFTIHLFLGLDDSLRIYIMFNTRIFLIIHVTTQTIRRVARPRILFSQFSWSSSFMLPTILKNRCYLRQSILPCIHCSD